MKLSKDRAQVLSLTSPARHGDAVSQSDIAYPLPECVLTRLDHRDSVTCFGTGRARYAILLEAMDVPPNVTDWEDVSVVMVEIVPECCESPIIKHLNLCP